MTISYFKEKIHIHAFFKIIHANSKCTVTYSIVNFPYALCYASVNLKVSFTSNYIKVINNNY